MKRIFPTLRGDFPYFRFEVLDLRFIMLCMMNIGGASAIEVNFIALGLHEVLEFNAKIQRNGGK